MNRKKMQNTVKHDDMLITFIPLQDSAVVEFATDDGRKFKKELSANQILALRAFINKFTKNAYGSAN